MTLVVLGAVVAVFALAGVVLAVDVAAVHRRCAEFLARRGVWRDAARWQEVLRDPVVAARACAEAYAADLGGSAGSFYPNPRTSMDGPLVLGRVVGSEVVVGLSVEELVAGQLVCAGVKGAGKSTLLSVTGLGLARAGASYTLFDWASELGWLAAYDRELVVLDARDLVVAPFSLDLEEYDARRNAYRACHAFANSTALLGGSLAELVRCVDELGAQRGFRFAFEDLTRRLSAERVRGGPRRDFIERWRNRMGLVLAELGEQLCGTRDMVRHLLGRRVIVQGGPAIEEARRLLASLVLNALVTYREQCPAMRVRDLHVVGATEGHLLFPRHTDAEVQPELGRPAFAQAALDARKRGLGLVVDVASVSSLSRVITANTVTWACFHTTDGRDLGELSSYLNVSPEQVRVIRELPRGVAVVRTPRWPGPVLVQTLDVPRVVVPQAELDERRRAFLEAAGWNVRARSRLEYPAVVVVPLEDEGGGGSAANTVKPASAVSGPKTVAASDREAGRADNLERMPSGAEHAQESRGDDPETNGVDAGAGGAAGPAGATGVSARGLSVLRAACERPFSFVSEVQARLGLGGSAFQRAYRELATHAELISFVKVGCGTSGKPPMWARAEGAAFELLGLKRPDWLDSYRRGEGLHRLWQERVASFFRRRGAKAQIEAPLGERRVDVFVETREGERVVLEVSLSVDTVVDNLRGARKAGGFDQIVFLFDSSQALARGRALAEAECPGLVEGVEWDLLGKYVRGGEA